MWDQSLLPDSYSVMSMGHPDYGVDAKGHPIAAHEGDDRHGMGMVSVATLVERSRRKPAVVADLTAQSGTISMAGHELNAFTLNGETRVRRSSPGKANSSRFGCTIRTSRTAWRSTGTELMSPTPKTAL